MFFEFFKFAIVGVMIIMGVTIAIRRFKYFKDENIQQDKKTDNDLEKNGKSKSIKALTIVIDVIFALLIPPGLVVAMIAPMTFDEPGSDKDFFNWLFFCATFSFPIVILMGIITSLIFLFILKSHKKAIVFSLLPTLNIIIVIVTILLHKKL